MSQLATLAAMVVSLLTSLLPALGSSSSAVVDQVIVTLIQIIPVIVNEVSALVGPVQNIIAVLRANTSVTATQMQQLIALQAQADAAFDAAAAADGLQPPGATGATGAAS